MKKGLEKVLKEKVKPIIDAATLKTLGLTSPEIKTDISDQLSRSPLVDLPIDASMQYKQAKQAFKKFYIQKLLKIHFGNISQVAKISGVDRRSVHRLARKFRLDVPKIRKDMMKAEYYSQARVSDILENTIETYKDTFHDKKLKELAEYLPKLSKDIAKEMPDVPLSFKEAEGEFEKRFFILVLEENKHNISKTARQIGLRYETLYRKLKALKMV
jgi:DNA-binding NtrC family response regulator